jgi:hypothetical protein
MKTVSQPCTIKWRGGEVFQHLNVLDMFGKGHERQAIQRGPRKDAHCVRLGKSSSRKPSYNRAA